MGNPATFPPPPPKNPHTQATQLPPPVPCKSTLILEAGLSICTAMGAAVAAVTAVSTRDGLRGRKRRSHRITPACELDGSMWGWQRVFIEEEG